MIGIHYVRVFEAHIQCNTVVEKTIRRMVKVGGEFVVMKNIQLRSGTTVRCITIKKLI